MDGTGDSALSPPQAILRFIVEMAALVCWAVCGWRIGSGAWSWILAVALPVAAAVAWGTFRVPGDQSANGEAKVAVPGIVRLCIEVVVLLGAAVVTVVVWDPVVGIVLGAAMITHYLATTPRVRWLARTSRLDTRPGLGR